MHAFWSSEIFDIFWRDYASVLASFVFSRFDGLTCICIIIRTVYLYLYVAECLELCMYYTCDEAYTRVVYFLYIYIACDVLYYCFMSCVADP